MNPRLVFKKSGTYPALKSPAVVRAFLDSTDDTLDTYVRG